MPVSIQLVIFAAIAAFVLFQLYNVLGKKVGRQPEDDARKQTAAVASAALTGEAAQKPDAALIDPSLALAVAGLKAREPGFDPLRFLDGARQAYETIVRGYAANDRNALQPLLSPLVMTSFEAGMSAREGRGETEQVEFVAPPRADLELATVDGDKAVARVRFLAELRSRISGAGAEARVEERRTAEDWTFERRLGSSDPNWVLARVEPAQA